MAKKIERLDDLAVFGASPAFDSPLHVGCPNIGDSGALMRRIREVLDSKWLTNNGRFVQEFEGRLRDLTGVQHCIAMSNGTLALESLIRAGGVRGEVIVPSFTFVATVHALAIQGLTPRFCDIDPLTHNIDPGRVEALITENTSAILAVHLWGRTCAIEALEQIAARHGLLLFFDAAHALACSHRGRMVGGLGDAEVFSFHATKFVNSFEGGMVATNDGALAERLRLLRNFGFTGYDRVESLGTNAKMCEVAAAMGLTSLDSIDEFIAVNRRNFFQYRQQLDGLGGLCVAGFDERECCNYQYVVLEVDELESGLSRDRLIEVLFAENVLARRYFYPGCHRMEPYATRYPDAGRDLPHTEHLGERVLCLPTGVAVGSREIDTIAGVVRVALQHSGELRDQWPQRVRSSPQPAAPPSIRASQP